MTKNEIQDLLHGKAIVLQKLKNLYEECKHYESIIHNTPSSDNNYLNIIRDYKTAAHNFLLFTLDVLNNDIKCANFFLYDNRKEFISENFAIRPFLFYGEDDDKPFRTIEVDCEKFRTNIFGLHYITLVSMVNFAHDLAEEFIKGLNDD